MESESETTKIKIDLGDASMEGEGNSKEIKEIFSELTKHMSKKRIESLLTRKSKLLIRRVGIDAAILEIDKTIEFWKSDKLPQSK